MQEGDVSRRLNGVNCHRKTGLGSRVGHVRVAGAAPNHHLTAGGTPGPVGILTRQHHLEIRADEGSRAPLVGELPAKHVHGRAADKGGNERVGRCVVHVVGRPELLEARRTHDRNLVGHGHRFQLIVRHIDDGGAEFGMEPFQLRTHLHPELGIQVRQRLVHQEHLGVAHQRPPQGHALLLPAREFPRAPLQQGCDAQNLGGLAHPLVEFGLGCLPHLQRKGQILVDALVRVERVILEHHGDVPVFRVKVVDDLVVDGNGAVGDLDQSGDQVERGGLATTGRTDQRDKLTVLNCQVHIVDGNDVVVGLDQILEYYLGHAASSRNRDSVTRRSAGVRT